MYSLNNYLGHIPKSRDRKGNSILYMHIMNVVDFLNNNSFNTLKIELNYLSGI